MNRLVDDHKRFMHSATTAGVVVRGTVPTYNITNQSMHCQNRHARGSKDAAGRRACATAPSNGPIMQEAEMAQTSKMFWEKIAHCIE